MLKPRSKLWDYDDPMKVNQNKLWISIPIQFNVEWWDWKKNIQLKIKPKKDSI
jgi:hypothetical protein